MADKIYGGESGWLGKSVTLLHFFFLPFFPFTSWTDVGGEALRTRQQNWHTRKEVSLQENRSELRLMVHRGRYI